MELAVARQIIDTLAQGIHPVTGELMPEDSPYNAPPVIRALFAVSQALDNMERPVNAIKPRKGLPPNAGKPWSAQDDQRLEACFAAGIDLKSIASEIGRTTWGVEARLIKLGKVPVKTGGRMDFLTRNKSK